MNRNRIYILLGAGLILLISVIVFTKFLAFQEVFVVTNGWELHDPIMNAMPRADVSNYIFGITYGSLLLYAFLERKKDLLVAKIAIAYSILLWFRLFCLWLIPLQAPGDLVFLEDPFLNNLVYPGDITADLFFSGHAGLLFILFFTSKRYVFFVLGLILSFLLMVQRVHYSIDVFAALPFAYLIVRLTHFVISRIRKS